MEFLNKEFFPEKWEACAPDATPLLIAICYLVISTFVLFTGCRMQYIIVEVEPGRQVQLLLEENGNLKEETLKDQIHEVISLRYLTPESTWEGIRYRDGFFLRPPKRLGVRNISMC